MKQNYWLAIPVIFPMICGCFSILMGRKKTEERKISGLIMIAALAECALLIPCLLSEESLTIGYLTEALSLSLKADLLGKIFAGLVVPVMALVCLYAQEYLSEDGRGLRFFGIFLTVEGILVGLCFSGNLITFYLFFEWMTLISMLLVLHDLTHQAIMAALKYLFYSVAGAFSALFGIFLLSDYGGLGEFKPGGILLFVPEGKKGIVLLAIFLMIMGFGTKAGIFPMHSWLPTAHPEAPAPASAILSGIITKMGILGVIRSIYFVARPQILRGSWVQYAWMTLALITVFMGSMMAYREQKLKKRLAYSTVSQVSYILFGLSLLNRTAFAGAILHVIFHSLAKDTLFMGAGAVIRKSGIRRVDELKGIGRVMPVTIGCFTLASFTLIGIPPTGGFLSKWDICMGALAAGAGIFSWAGPAVLLVSALLTAGYLLPVTVKGFFPGEGFDHSSLEIKEASWKTTLPMIILVLLTLGMGIIPEILLGPVNVLSGMIW